MIDHTYNIFVSMIREGKLREKKRREKGEGRGKREYTSPGCIFLQDIALML